MNRRFILERVTSPDLEPVSRAELVAHLRGYTSNTDENTLLDGLIVGAREWVERETSRALIDQTWRLSVGDELAVDVVQNSVNYSWGYYSTSQPSEIFLRRSPALAIVSFKSVDAAGVETDVDSDTYELRDADSKWPRIVGLNGATWCTGLFRVTFRAGYADRTSSPQEDATVVPECFKQAIKLHAEAIYDRDERMMEKLLEVAASLIVGERCDLGMA